MLSIAVKTGARALGVWMTSLGWALVGLLATACGGPAADGTTAIGKRALLDQVNIKLSVQDCPGAVSTIKPLYESADVDNTVRHAMAASYACHAHLNLFDVVTNMVENPSSLAGSGFFQFMSKQFPSSATDPNDRVVEGAQLASDALMSELVPGGAILGSNTYAVAPFNTASMLFSDRTDASNLYLFFVSMAAIGGYENRFGAPSAAAAYLKTVNLPWTSGDLVDANGCGIASSMLNFVDSVGVASRSLSGPVTTVMSALETQFKTAMDAACHVGCLSCAGGGVSCATCPSTLRNRSSCLKTLTDVNSCAAAGMVQAINTLWLTAP